MYIIKGVLEEEEEEEESDDNDDQAGLDEILKLTSEMNSATTQLLKEHSENEEAQSIIARLDHATTELSRQAEDEIRDVGVITADSPTLARAREIYREFEIEIEKFLHPDESDYSESEDEIEEAIAEIKAAEEK